MKISEWAIVTALVAVLAACASVPQALRPMDPAAIGTSAGRVGILVTVPDKADTHFPGTGCQHCLSVAQAAHTSLTRYVRTLSRQGVVDIRDKILAAFSKRQIPTVSLPTDVRVDSFPRLEGANTATRDFTSLKARYQIDHLLVVQVGQLGVERPHLLYFPSGPARAIVRGEAYLVNLADNTLDWYQPIAVDKTTAGAWDEPPAFPGLTKAYFQAIEQARETVVGPLK